MARTKKYLLMLLMTAPLFQFGCGDSGWWKYIHQAIIHFSDVTQWVAAYDQLGIV